MTGPRAHLMANPRRDVPVVADPDMARYRTPLHTTFEWDENEDGLPFVRSVTRLEWEPTGLIYFLNVGMFVLQCDDVHALGLAVPPMPPGVQIRLTTNQFAPLLEHPAPAIREWVMVNIVPRIRLRSSPPRHHSSPAR